MSNYIVYVQLLGIIIFGSVVGEYYRMKQSNTPITGEQFLANFIMSVFATFMIVLYLFDKVGDQVRRVGLAGFISIQDYNIVNKIIMKLINLKVSFKEGDD